MEVKFNLITADEVGGVDSGVSTATNGLARSKLCASTSKTCILFLEPSIRHETMSPDVT